MQVISGFPLTMGDEYPLNTTTLIRHAVRTYPSQEIVYRTPEELREHLRAPTSNY